MIFQAPDLTAVVRPAPAGRRRRQKLRKKRARKATARTPEAAVAAAAADAADAAAADPTASPVPTTTRPKATETTRKKQKKAPRSTLEDGVTSRRRRRRRRGDQDLELTGGEDNDPPNTVTRVRAPRAAAEAPVNNRVTSLKGSTRLEAKKQRRRESRDTGRRRTVITEAEFLARRESVDRQMIVRQRDDRIQIGVLEDGVLAEHFVSKTQQDSLIGNVYLGKVQNVLPSMEAAFVDIGRGRNAVLYAGEVNWESVNLEGKQRRIENALKSGDSVLVQVTKDPVGPQGRPAHQPDLAARPLPRVRARRVHDRHLAQAARRRTQPAQADPQGPPAGEHRPRPHRGGGRFRGRAHARHQPPPRPVGRHREPVHVQQDPCPGTALRRT